MFTCPSFRSFRGTVALCGVQVMLFAFALLALSAAAGCRQNSASPKAWPSSDFEVQLQIVDTILYADDPVPEYTAYITWKDYDGIGSPENALYLFNGEEIGRGEEGFYNLLRRVTHLEAGSDILIYPRYPLSYRNDPGFRSYPWSGVEDLLRFAAFRRLIQLYYSPRDHNGDLVPGAEADLIVDSSTRARQVERPDPPG